MVYQKLHNKSLLNSESNPKPNPQTMASPQGITYGHIFH